MIYIKVLEKQEQVRLITNRRKEINVIATNISLWTIDETEFVGSLKYKEDWQILRQTGSKEKERKLKLIASQKS